MLAMIQCLPFVAQIMVYVIAMNLALQGIKSGLDMIKDKTTSQVDNNAATAIGKICGMLSSLIDLLGMNKEH